ncbi:hypothetical protein ILUMI_14900, partial [Ignelater luminosus]
RELHYQKMQLYKYLCMDCIEIQTSFPIQNVSIQKGLRKRIKEIVILMPTYRLVLVLETV